MKKLFASIVATIMAASFALPLAACGGGGELVSERLPENNFEEAWKEAFSHLSDENIKIEFAAEEHSSQEEDREYNHTIVRDGDMERWTTTSHAVEDSNGVYTVPVQDVFIDFSSVPLKSYACGADGVMHVCRLTGDDVSWADQMTKEAQEFDPPLLLIRDVGNWNEKMEYIGKLSDSVHYSGNDKGYVYETASDPDDYVYGYRKMIIKFKGGKVASFYYGYCEKYEDYEFVVSYSWTITYGGQEVHLPSDEECDHGVRAMQSDILPEAGFAEAVEKALNIYDSENIKIEFGGGGYGSFISGKLIHADKKEYYFECSGDGSDVIFNYIELPSNKEGYCDLRGETPVGFLQSSDGTRQEYNEAMFREGIEHTLLIFFFDFFEIKSAPQELHYSEADKGYVWGAEDEINGKWIIKFKNGKIASIYLSGGFYGSYGPYAYDYMIYTYGGQTVTLPDMSAE